MGKGLSEQQKAILLIAYRNRLQYGDMTETTPGLDGKGTVTTKSRDVFAKEVLIHHYRWIPNPFSFDKQPYCYLYSNYQRERNNNLIGKHTFDKAFCGGEVEYNRANASVRRAIKRLKERGLLEDTAWAYYLTDAGMAVAKHLLQN